MKRKTFIKSAVLGAVGFSIVPRQVLGGRGYLAPSDRINLGYLGNGKMARGLLQQFSACKETLVIAASDVDRKKLTRFVALASAENAKKVNQAVQGYHDYRKLLERKDIDAVIVATPDHWHAQMTVDAAVAGKDIYCEKPLSLTVAEGRAMVNAVAKYDRVLQTGSKQRSMYNFRQAAELILNGYIGQLKEINVAIGEPVKQCDLPSMPVPGYLDWDRWVGPSLYRGYHPILSPPIEDDRWAWWRGYRHFGGGYITDWGAHMFDIVQWALGMDHSGPVSFIPPTEPGVTTGLSFRYANGVTVNHKLWGEMNAIQFVGEEGTVEVSRSFLRSTPSPIAEQRITDAERRVYFSDNHFQDWIDAVKSRTKPIAHAEIGHRSATICNIANIAYELQQPLDWDPETEFFTNNPSANMMLSRPYRGAWDFTNF